MKIKVIKSQKVVWSSITRETTVEVDGKTLTVRIDENDSGSDIWAGFDNDELVEVRRLKEPEFEKLAIEIALNMDYGMFDIEGDEFDSSEIIDDEIA